FRKNLVVGFGLPEGGDAAVLQQDHAMIELVGVVMNVAAGVAPIADVPPLERSTRRQDDIGELCIALEPNALRRDEVDRRMAGRGDEAVGVGERTEGRRAV